MERRRDKIAAWIVLILMTAGFFASIVRDVELARLDAADAREDRDARRYTLVKTRDAKDILFTHADDTGLDP